MLADLVTHHGIVPIIAMRVNNDNLTVRQHGYMLRALRAWAHNHTW